MKRIIVTCTLLFTCQYAVAGTSDDVTYRMYNREKDQKALEAFLKENINHPLLIDHLVESNSWYDISIVYNRVSNFVTYIACQHNKIIGLINGKPCFTWHKKHTDRALHIYYLNTQSNNFQVIKMLLHYFANYARVCELSILAASPYNTCNEWRRNYEKFNFILHKSYESWSIYSSPAYRQKKQTSTHVIPKLTHNNTAQKKTWLHRNRHNLLFGGAAAFAIGVAFIRYHYKTKTSI